MSVSSTALEKPVKQAIDELPAVLRTAIQSVHGTVERSGEIPVHVDLSGRFVQRGHWQEDRPMYVIRLPNGIKITLQRLRGPQERFRYDVHRDDNVWLSGTRQSIARHICDEILNRALRIAE